ncbi:hypothetical protein L3Y34_000564 [Caenorhabditis briggsae]|uniref:Tyrosine specific protein phosphatases domain-containing protein n=1 Tax=Caenorhabditis briggsae TaxID=6238 RepID=A0AAE9D9L3_CAEBR|nr:hypothetical protein L3Y34_000564 [Caenorhabditis briggsae]
MFMASGFEEGGKTVCYKYIPLKEGEIVRVGSFEIKCTEYKEFANGQVVRRKLEVKYSDLNPEKEVSFTVEHVQYAKSTDGDLSECPMNPKIFSNLVRIARKNKKPVIIHCRDGVNRSGAFAYDIREIDAQWKKDKDEIDAKRKTEQTELEKVLAKRRKEMEKEGWIYSEKGYTRHRNTGKQGEWYQEDDDGDIRDLFEYGNAELIGKWMQMNK